jgi:hypothetical protein
MKEIRTAITLQTNDSTKRLLFSTRYLVQINFTFELYVISAGFSGCSHFCVRIDELEHFTRKLMKIYGSRSGSAKLNDNDSNSFLSFEMAETGHLIVSGQVGGSHEDHYMTFKFHTDQTCIPHFVEEFNALLKNRDEFVVKQ